MDGFNENSNEQQAQHGMPSPFLENNQGGHYRGINPSSDDSYVHD